MLRGFAWGAGLGAAATALYVGLDPNLSPHLVRATLASGSRFLAFFLLAGGAVGVLCALLPPRPRAPAAGALLGASLPWLGLGGTVAGSPVTPWTVVPGHTGALLTTTERDFLIGFALIALAAAWPLARWGRTLAARASPRRTTGVAGACVLIGAVACTALSRSGWGPAEEAGTPPPNRRVVLIGIDGADWDELGPLIEQGMLPNLGALRRRGATGRIKTFRPTQSPIVWTTVATGQPSHRHGVQGFLEERTQIPYTSNTRRVPALWNLLGDQGIPVGVVGWWVTWPAEPVNGWLVSYHAVSGQGVRKGSLYEDLPHQTYPDDLQQTLRPLILPSLAVGRATVDRILAHHHSPEDPQRHTRRNYVSAWSYGADQIFSQAAARILAAEAPRFLATYFSSVDVTSHNYCSGYPWRDAICGRAIEAAYRFVDERIGMILAAADPNALVIVASDHGFDRIQDHAHHLPPGPDGVLMVAGPGTRAGGEIEGASVFDLAPTVLALFDLPIPRDFRGRPLLSAFEPSFVADWRIRTGPPLPRRPASEPIPAATDSDFKDRLRALGYID